MSTKNTTKIGNITEGAVLAALMRAGKTVFVPFGAQAEFDLVFLEGNEFRKVQCKTGRIRNGVIRVHSKKVKHDRKSNKYFNVKYTRESIDFFGVYCPDNNKSYLVPSRLTKLQISLRLDKCKNAQNTGVVWADHFEI